MHAHERPHPAARIAVRRKRWDAAWTAAGCPTHTARAAALGVTHSTASRVGRGEIPPSAAIIGAALGVLELPFEDLFEVVADPDATAPPSAA
jgi:transcriptional regulator with XRE-family HTH domain